MFIKNFLKPGDYLMTVPAGLPLTLQYNEKGNLDKLYQGWKDNKVKVTEEFYTVFIKSGACPTRISVKNGTTWITGVLYSSEVFSSPGNLPDCIFDKLKETFLKDSSNFKFYAGNVESLATLFRGANPIVNWLKMSKFNVLPGWIVPANLNKDAFYKMIDTERFTSKFIYGLVSNYIVYRGGDVIYANTGMKQFVVSRASKFIDDYGYIKCTIHPKDSSMNAVVLNYSDVVRFNIQTNSLLVLDCNDSVMYTCATDNKKREPRSSKVSCDICGKSFSVPKTGVTECSDPHCKSKWFIRINHMLSVLKLPLMKRNRFDEVISSLICLTDIFTLEEYSDVEVNISLATLLESIVPVTSVSNPQVFKQFSSKCKNTIKTFQYYVHNPDRILNDLELTGMFATRLIDWLSDSYNQSDIDCMLDCPQIKISLVGKKFDGAPIFRNKLIMITGSFKHGEHDEIEAIFRSYSADVTEEFSSDVDCIVVGDLLEDINGAAVRQANNLCIPVFQESEFFNRYEIDKDMEENLV